MEDFGLDSLQALTTTAETWLVHDPHEPDRAQVRTWIDAAQRGDEAARDALARAFAGPLTFGTAGLRGPIGPGESSMNSAVVTRTTAGLATYLQEVVGAPDHAPRLVVGYDARHGSSRFARDAVEVAAAAGCEAMLLPGPLPTPVLAFAARHLEADAGVMITASHNPAADNGYKVYLGGRAADGPGRGVQIVLPADAQIAAAIAAAPPADEVPRSGAGVRQLGDDLLEAYLRRAAAIVAGTAPLGTHRQRLRVVLTPMHGVGGFVAQQALLALGFADVHVVSEQAAPDPDFPTVPFPNPEEAGALDLAIDLARRVEADLVVALDPDADRCSVAVPTGATGVGSGGGWRQLSGDDVGALLGRDAADRDTGRGVLASSVVSGRLLGRIAAAAGLRHVTTLTGFKWIARVDGLAYGYEEAIGYCTDPQAVRDKDGITAAVRVVDLASRLGAGGRSLLDALDDLAREHGLHATAPVTVRVEDVTRIGAAMARLRAHPPTELAGSPVTQVVDLADPGPDSGPDCELPATDGMLLLTAADDRVVVRPSGTEPKLKGYLEVVLPVPQGQPVPHERAAARLRLLRTDVSAALGL